MPAKVSDRRVQNVDQCFGRPARASQTASDRFEPRVHPRQQASSTPCVPLPLHQHPSTRKEIDRSKQVKISATHQINSIQFLRFAVHSYAHISINRSILRRGSLVASSIAVAQVHAVRGHHGVQGQVKGVGGHLGYDLLRQRQPLCTCHSTIMCKHGMICDEGRHPRRASHRSAAALTTVWGLGAPLAALLSPSRARKQSVG
jgi:hypothetical protein